MPNFNVITVILSLIIGVGVKFGLYGESAFLFCVVVFNLWVPEYDIPEDPKE